MGNNGFRFWKFVVVLGAVLLCGSCVTRADVEADLWQHDQLPAELCASNPQLASFGIYRVVYCKNAKNNPRCTIPTPPVSYEEFIPYCDPTVIKYLGMHEDDLNFFLSKLTTPSSTK